MRAELSSEQTKYVAHVRQFVDQEIVPNADQYDVEQCLPEALVDKLRAGGYLGAVVPKGYDGQELDMITFGLLCREFGRGCSSVRTLLTVQSMVCQVLRRWGNEEQKAHWLPRLGRAEAIGAFALSEPEVGSDAASVQTVAVLRDGQYVINGKKKWISFAQIADVFLVFTQCEGRQSALLVERDTPGLRVRPIREMLGTRASMLGELTFEECAVPAGNLVGGEGFGLTAIALTALDLGRYSVAWGCVGIGDACLEASLRYSSERKQFGTPIRNHQLVAKLVADMVTNVSAAALLCHRAGQLRDDADPQSIGVTCMAKYFASRMASRVTSDTVQLHGAVGCSDETSIQRYYRDAKIMEIIEGSNQIQQLLISGFAYKDNLSSAMDWAHDLK